MTTEQQLSDLQNAREQYNALVEQINSIHVKIWLIDYRSLPRDLWDLRQELDCRYGYPTEGNEQIAAAVAAQEKRTNDAYEETLRIEAAEKAKRSVWLRLRETIHTFFFAA